MEQTPQQITATDKPTPPPARRVSLAAWPLIALVRVYQVALSPLMAGHCRFQPTCSRYSIEALRTHGALRGSWLTVRRVLRCHPLGGFGYDPVPPKRAKTITDGAP